MHFSRGIPVAHHHHSGKEHLQDSRTILRPPLLRLWHLRCLGRFVGHQSLFHRTNNWRVLAPIDRIAHLSTLSHFENRKLRPGHGCRVPGHLLQFSHFVRGDARVHLFDDGHGRSTVLVAADCGYRTELYVHYGDVVHVGLVVDGARGARWRLAVVYERGCVVDVHLFRGHVCHSVVHVSYLVCCVALRLTRGIMVQADVGIRSGGRSSDLGAMD